MEFLQHEKLAQTFRATTLEFDTQLFGRAGRLRANVRGCPPPVTRLPRAGPADRWSFDLVLLIL